MSATTTYSLLFPCSGAADVGSIADLAARKLTHEKCGSIYCLAAVAAGVPTAMARSAGACRLVAIDGCNQACASRILEAAGFPCERVELGDLGLVKGESPVNDEHIELVAAAVRARLV